MALFTCVQLSWVNFLKLGCILNINAYAVRFIILLHLEEMMNLFFFLKFYCLTSTCSIEDRCRRQQAPSVSGIMNLLRASCANARGWQGWDFVTYGETHPSANSYTTSYTINSLSYGFQCTFSIRIWPNFYVPPERRMSGLVISFPA